MRLFLDDIRKEPKGWILCKTADEAIALIDAFKNNITHISFDHDLGIGLDGNDVAMHIETLCHKGKMKCPKWQIHSSNPVGRKEISATMKSAERFSNGD